MKKDLIFKYLGYRNVTPDELTLKLIDECISEIESLSNFKYYWQEFDEILPFLKENKNYLSYLGGATSYILVGTTLGIDIDRRMRQYEKIDTLKALIFDCCASAYIEEMADSFESSLPFNNMSYRFCPGYCGTSFLDNQIIAKYINASKNLGINFLSSGLMVPLKSMIGIVAIGNKQRKTCANCIMLTSCNYRKAKTTCYKK